MDLFLNYLQESCLLRNPPDDLNEFVALHDFCLTEILNKHAPIKKRSVPIRSVAPWYSEEIQLVKRKKRRLERRWPATRSLCDREAYSHQCKALKTLLSASSCQYYSNLVTENQTWGRFSQHVNYFAGVLKRSIRSMIHQLLWLMISYFSLEIKSGKFAMTLTKLHTRILVLKTVLLIVN